MAIKQQKSPKGTELYRNNHSRQYVTTAFNCDPAHAFWDAMVVVFGRNIPRPLPDGEIHRFHVPGDRQGSKNGAYQLFPDSIPSGWYGTWKDGGKWHTWSSRQPANSLEAEQLRQRSERARLQREIELKKSHQEATETALRLWRNACPADPNHPYLVAKGCQPHGLRQLGHMLLVPLYHEGQLINLQCIFPDGRKRFLEGGMTKGCYSPLGIIEPGQPVYVCEGWATGATIHEETGAAVACAMTASNLLAVGEYLRRRYPEAVLIFGADDDRQNPNNPGRTYAIKAAAAMGCGLVLPPWSGAEPLSCSDFNDLRQYLAQQRKPQS